jgi:hypothetical protein
VRQTGFALLAAALAALAQPAAAQSEGSGDGERKTPYVVRYLVFQHQDYWDDPTRILGPESHKERKGADGEVQQPGGRDPFDPLWRRLSDSSRYRPLVQGVTVPFALPREEASPITIEGAWPASIRPGFAGLSGAGERVARLTRGAGWAPPRSRTGDWDTDRLRGTLTFYKGRYAHLAVNLLFTEQRRWMPWGIDRQHHLLVQSRRLLPGRTYYFDHSRFGVIARVEPMD